MKIFYASLVALVFFSCRKEYMVDDDTIDFRKKVVRFMADKYDTLLVQVDTGRMYISLQPEIFVRVGLKGKDIGEEMLLFRINKQGTVEGGKRIHLRIDDDSLNGNIAIFDLSGALIIEAVIKNGDALLGQTDSYPSSAAQLEGDGYVMFPMMQKKHDKEGPSVVEYVNMQRMYNNLVQLGGTARSGYYNLRYPDSREDYGGGGATAPAPYTIMIDRESLAGKTALNMKAIVDCFYTIPATGTSCSIEIFADIPVDTDPTAIFDWYDGSPGHCFIRLTKSGGGKTATAIVGFYPESSIKASQTTATMTGAFFDNSKHEYNAAMKMNISVADMDRCLSYMQIRAAKPFYDIDDYNCSDFALQIFNLARPTNPLKPGLIHIPTSPKMTGSVTPQGVYLEIVRQHKMNAAERSNIVVPAAKAYAGESGSPCK